MQCPSCRERGGLTGPADALPGPKAAAPEVVVALPSLPKLLAVTPCSFRMFDNVTMAEKVNHHTSEGREGGVKQFSLKQMETKAHTLGGSVSPECD